MDGLQEAYLKDCDAAVGLLEGVCSHLLIARTVT